MLLHLLASDLDNLRIGDTNDAEPPRLGFVGLELPLHPVAVVADVSFGEHDKLRAEPGPRSYTDVYRSGKGGVCILQKKTHQRPLRFKEEWIEEFIERNTIDPENGIPLPRKRMQKIALDF